MEGTIIKIPKQMPPLKYKTLRYVFLERAEPVNKNRDKYPTFLHVCIRVYVCSVAKSWLILLLPIFCNPPGSSVHRISHARILEWAVIPFSRGSSWPKDWTHVSCIGRLILYQVAVIKGMMRVCGRGVTEDGVHDWIGAERSFLHLWKGYFNNFVK